MWKGRQTLQCLILVLLAFLTSASSLYGQPKYMVLVPAWLYTETPEKICFHLYNLNETVTVKASLQFHSGSRSLFNELVVDKDLFHCVSFTLPRVSPSYERGYLSVHIKGPEHEFSKKNVVLVWNKVNAVFVQTDKPVYKPGQSVKFRVVSMDTNLHPLNELFPLAYIEDPKRNRIMQWRDVTTETGLKQLSFSLSSEPILGSYKIVILKQSGDKKEHPFTVEEFMLPRFEVQVRVPKAISIQDEKLNVTVCGMYTYGKPVPGHAKIHICYKYKEHIKNKETGCKEVSSQLDNNGCTTQEGNISVFELKQRYYEVQHLQVDAKVTEEGTGSQPSCSSHSPRLEPSSSSMKHTSPTPSPGSPSNSSGSLFNNAMKGGVEDEVTLSAYVTIALLESSLKYTHPIVSKALACLETSWKTIEQGGNGSFVYTKALLAYAFALAGSQDKKNEILKSLDNGAIKEDNSIHWERPQKPRKPKSYLYEPQAPSAEVEMNAYVLLTLLTAQPAPTPEDLTLATLIVKWLTKQQNSHGGFSSTQDTVVALHALSVYGAATFTRSQKTPLVTIQSSGTFSRKFQVENSNRLLLQQVSLPDIPGNYDINVSGEGCVHAQTTLKYNVHLEKQESAFALRVQTVALTCDNPEGHNSFQISLEISYTGSRPASNMVIADMKMVSGFIPLKATVKKLERSEHVSRTEVSTSNVLLYVDQMTNQTLAFSFIVQQDIPVMNLQPAIVKVYDYYETDEVALAEYSAPCSSEKQNF